MTPTSFLASLESLPAPRPEPREPAAPGTSTLVERLPFRICVVRGAEALRKAVRIRHLAYGRHVPALAQALREPETDDSDRDTMVLLAESRLDGEPIGTIRVQSNRLRPLSVEHSVELPERLRGERMVEATRLAVAGGRTGRMVKAALIKALYLHCLQADIAWVVAGARPGLDRQYEALLMDDLFPGRTVPLLHTGGLPHRVMALDVHGAYDRWQRGGHPLFHFMCGIAHPDIDLRGADALPWQPFLPQAEMAAGRRALLRSSALQPV
jgi:hypothetical protein